MKRSDKDHAEALAHLRKMLRRGSTIYTGIDHASASGMSRRISLYVVRKGQIQNITGWVGRVLDYTRHRDGGLTVQGCGMDMGFHLVNSLSYALHGMGPREREAREALQGFDRPGYSFEHRWL